MGDSIKPISLENWRAYLNGNCKFSIDGMTNVLHGNPPLKIVPSKHFAQKVESPKTMHLEIKKKPPSSSWG